jgi:hypothetical protein
MNSVTLDVDLFTFKIQIRLPSLGRLCVKIQPVLTKRRKLQRLFPAVNRDVTHFHFFGVPSVYTVTCRVNPVLLIWHQRISRF